MLDNLASADLERLLGLARAKAGSRPQAGPALVPRAPEQAPPLSFAQQRLWLLAQMDGVSEAYHVPLGLRLVGDLDAAALRRALDRIVARHEALRTTFQGGDEHPVQRIEPAHAGLLLREHDLAGHPRAEAELERIAREEASARFDLEPGPPIRGRLVRLGPSEHVLLLTMHHIVSDGWSLGLLTRELTALYAAFRESQEDPLPPLEVQYADYALWQRRWLTGEVLEKQIAYWRRSLAGAPAFLELPADRPRPAAQSFAGGLVEVELDEELTRGLKALARRHGTTLYTVVLAGWAVVLSRLSGQDEVVIGSPVAGRTRPEVEGLIGFFVNTLALRVSLAGGPSVAELLDRLKAQALEAQDHQELPFEQVVDLLKPPRSVAHTPVFQVMLSWQNNDGGRLDLPGLTVTPEPLRYEVAKVDLELSLGEADGRIVGVLVYPTALFDAASVERHAGYLRRVLAAMVADEGQPADRIDLLGSAERHRLVVEWNRTDGDYPGDRLLHQFFEAQAAARPGATAVVARGEVLDYATLNARANRLAHFLRGQGVAGGQLVGLCLRRTPQLVVGLLAIVKAGGAYVPLDPDWPEDRQQQIVADLGLKRLLTEDALLGRARAVAAGCPALRQLLCVDVAAPSPAEPAGEGPEVRTAWDWRDYPADDPGPAATVDDVAYVIFTSGSTGRPKGIVVTHRPVANLIDWVNGTFDVGPADRLLFTASACFDLSVYDVFGVLGAGGSLHLADEETVRDPEALLRLLVEEPITFWDSAPAALQQLVPGFPEAPTSGRLRLVFNSGDWIPVGLPDAVRRTFPQARFVALGGATEATVWSNWYPVERVEPGWPSIPYGRPIRNARYYVLDRHLAPCPVGVAGALYIGGLCLAKGYTDPVQTAERFIRSPLPEDSGRLYDTGDQARYLPDGNLQFLGRRDFQVKIRGFRVELEEIEAALRSHPAVREAVVLAREDGGDRRLVAYLTLAPPGAEVAALRAHAAAKLPEYMVPGAYVVLEEWPVTPNGKLDRKALPAPDGAAFVSRAYEAPAGEVEAALARIWADLLGVGRVGRHDNFFELGGHSLLAITVLKRMREEGLRADVRALFAASSLAALAAATEPVVEVLL